MAMVFSRKIIFLNRFFYPDHAATSQLLTDLAFDLAKRQEKVHVITSRLRYDDPSTCLPDRQQVNGVLIHRVWTSHFGRHFLPGRAIDYLTFHLGVFFRLLLIINRNDLVVVKTDPPLLSVTVLAIVWLRRAVLLTWNQDLFPEIAAKLGVQGIGKSLFSLLKWLRNLSLRYATINIVPGNRMGQRLQQEGIKAEQIRVIHNWSDGQIVTPIPAKENALRQEWGLTDRFVVGYSGNMGRAHEFNTILAAAERLKNREDIVFLFIGAGAGQEKVAAIAQARQLSNILLKPYQPRERLAFSLSVPDMHWISLLPKLGELIVPSKFYGIAAAGRAIIYVGDSADDIPKLLRDGSCGVTVPVGEGELLAQQIAAWADDQETCRRIGKAARCLFDTRFDRPLAMTAWYQLIQESS